jgi:integrase
MESLITKLSNEYKANPNDEKFADRAKMEIANFKPTRRKTESKVDPQRLSSQAVALSTLKKRCLAFDLYHPDLNDQLDRVIAKYGADDPAWVEWDAADTLPKLVALQKQWKTETGVKAALAQVKTVPPVLEQLKLDKADSAKRVALQDQRASAKLRTSTDIDVDALMKRLFPGLNGSTFAEVIPALLLATGRRTVEILKTAVFTPISEYKVYFQGQVKKRGEVKYEIDLLAPADLCIKALQWVRDNVDCKNKSLEDINTTLGRKLNRAVSRMTGLKPHDMRRINGVACEKLYNKGKSAKSFIGYIKDQLGHDDVGSTARYQTFKVKITRPWKPEAAPETKVEAKEETKETKRKMSQSFPLGSKPGLSHR